MTKLTNSVINQMSTPVIKGEDTEQVTQTIRELRAVQSSTTSLGVAAPQIGILKRIILVRLSTGMWVFINPHITSRLGSRTVSREGCLSFPELGQVKKKRYKRITIEGFTPKWNPISFNLKGLDAFILQHEIDHLDGITISGAKS